MWKYGCLENPDRDSESDAEIVNGIDEMARREYDLGNVRFVLEGPLWVPVRAFSVPDDVLCTRTILAKWNILELYGPFAELYFF